MNNFPGNAVTTALVVTASQASTVTGPALDLLQFEGSALVIQNHGVSTGTLDGKLQHSDDGSTGWADTGITFAQAGTAASLAGAYFDCKTVKRWVRYVGTIVTGPCLLSVTLAAAKKYS